VQQLLLLLRRHRELYNFYGPTLLVCRRSVCTSVPVAASHTRSVKSDIA
jgi:hypothetical protein